MSDRLQQRQGFHRRGDTLVAKYCLGWVLVAILASITEAVSIGHITAPILAVDIIAGALVPFGLLSVALSFERPGQENPPGEEDEDDGGGSSLKDPGPLPPGGGLSIDWERFEADVQAYALSREALV